MSESILLATYGVWLALSLVRQTRWRRIASLGSIGNRLLVPNWSLFALPTRHDFRFQQQLTFRDGTKTSWENLEIANPKPGYAFVWHPQFVARKTALDLVKCLQTVTGGQSRRELQHVARYAAFVAYLTHAARQRDAVRVQFLVIAHRAHDQECPPAVTFLSDRIRVDSAE